MIEAKYAYAQHKGGFRPIRNARAVTVNLALDILNGCEHACPGCFVKRKNEPLEDGAALSQLVDDLVAAGYHTDELNIGPTDIFSAVNFSALMEDPVFVGIANQFNLTVATTLMNEYGIIAERMAEYKRAFPNRYVREHSEIKSEDGDVEVFVMIDLKRYLADDWFYKNQLKRNLNLLHDWSAFFMINVYSEDMFDEVDFPAVSAKIREDFGTKFRINPSYFRGTSGRHVEKYAQKHKQMLEQNISQTDMDRVFFSMADIHFNSFSTVNLSYSSGTLAVMPYLYDGIPQHDARFIIPKRDGKYHIEDIQQTIDRLLLSQYEYATETRECSTCQHLTCCASRNILSYMDTRTITDCLLPRQLFRDASRAVELELRNHD